MGQMRPIDADEATQYANEHLLNAYAWLITSFLQNCATIDLVKHGKWEEIMDPYGRIEGWLCECGREVKSKDNYCPNCGAMMDGGDIS